MTRPYDKTKRFILEAGSNILLYALKPVSRTDFKEEFVDVWLKKKLQIDGWLEKVQGFSQTTPSPL